MADPVLQSQLFFCADIPLVPQGSALGEELQTVGDSWIETEPLEEASDVDVDEVNNVEDEDPHHPQEAEGTPLVTSEDVAGDTPESQEVKPVEGPGDDPSDPGEDSDPEGDQIHEPVLVYVTVVQCGSQAESASLAL